MKNLNLMNFVLVNLIYILVNYFQLENYLMEKFRKKVESSVFVRLPSSETIISKHITTKWRFSETGEFIDYFV